MQTCRRNVGQNVAVGVCREYLGGGGADAGIAVDLAVLHRHELALVVGHIVEHRTVELHVAAPVIFVAADLDRALRDEGLDDKGSRGDGGVVYILACVKVEYRKLRRCKLVEHRRVDLRRRDRKLGVGRRFILKVRKVGKALVHLGKALDVADDHLRRHGIAV